MDKPSLILALNCGSSSLKFGVFAIEAEALQLVFEGEAEEIGRDEGTFWTRNAEGQRQTEKHTIADHETAFHVAWDTLERSGFSAIAALGHRVVHGGPKLRDHVRLDSNVRSELNDAAAFAPLHLPPSLAVIDAASDLLASVPQVVCLDTAFHRDLPDVAKTLPFPADIREQGIERYGFHGLAMEAIVEARPDLPRRTLVAHLGGGASVTALLNSKSIDTSMGLTPTGGFIMGTRTGDLDPGVMLYLMRHGMDSEQLETLVDRKSGILGVSGKSSDMRQVGKLRDQDANCDLALRMFAYQVTKTIAAMTAAMGGLDMLVFSGGIGEHDEALRSQITDSLSWMGKFSVEVFAAQEDLQIARITRRLTTPKA